MDNSTNERLREIFGDVAFSQPETPDKPTLVASSGKGYQKLRDHILKLDSNGLVTEWARERRPLLLCTTTNVVADVLATELQMYMIPAILWKQKTVSIFIARDCDNVLFSKAMAAIKFRRKSSPRILNYEQFKTYCDKDGIRDFYIKNISRDVMECIRREHDRTGCCERYTMFRMGGNNWGLGIAANDLISGDISCFSETCFAESVLCASLLLNGDGTAQYIDELQNDIMIDRLASIQFSPSLVNNDCVYIYDPSSPEIALKISSSDFRRLNISKIGNRWKVQEAKPHRLDIEGGLKLMFAALMQFVHKRIAYGLPELITAIQQNRHIATQERQTSDTLLLGKRILAHNMYGIFAEKNRNAGWFGSPAKAEENMDALTSEVSLMLDALANNKVIPDYSNHENNVLHNVVYAYQISNDTFFRAKEMLGAMQMGSIGLGVSKEAKEESVLSQIARYRKMLATPQSMDAPGIQL